MSLIAKFERCLAACPIVAILRGIRPDEVESITGALLDAGVRIIEVPLNTPDAFACIEVLAGCADGALVGAGTVLTEDQAAKVRDAGGELIVSPNCDPLVIEATVSMGLVSVPGVFTPSEALQALGCGATALKLFPAELSSPRGLASLRAILPTGTNVLIAGGVSPESVGPWRAAGAAGFGLGSALYRKGSSAAEVRENCAAFTAALADRSSASATGR